MADAHVLITGGASGIGAATARALVRAGCRVSVLDRLDETGCDWWQGLDPGARGRWIVVDAGDPSSLAAAIDTVCADGVTGLVTCAGVSLKEPFLQSEDKSWMTTLVVNVMGTAIAARSFARSLVAEGRGGSIVTLSSTVGLGYVEGLGAHYHASKGAIIALTRSMAGELGRYDIRVNSVAPGVVRTPLTAQVRSATGEDELSGRVPLTTLAEPEDVAEAVAFLLSDAAADITGHVLPVDGGQLAVLQRPPAGFVADQTDPESVSSAEDGIKMHRERGSHGA